MNEAPKSSDYDGMIDLYPDGFLPYDDDFDVNPAIISPKKFMVEVHEIISVALCEVIQEQRSNHEAKGRLSSCGRNGLMLFLDWAYEDGNQKCGWEHELISLSDDSKADMVIELALKGILPWQALTLSINSYLRNGLNLSPKYIDLIQDVLCGKLAPPKDRKFKKYEVDHPAYLMAARKIAFRFMLSLTRNDASQTYSALDAIAEATGISYATLKRECYQKYHNNY